MGAVRLGAVGYLNARPLVYGLDRSSRFDLRFDLPARCADLLHSDAIDLGLIPSIEYLRRSAGGYAIVPDLAIASSGPVASVALYASRPIADVRSIALDTSSRTSVALVQVLCKRAFRIAPLLQQCGPDVAEMLAQADAALIIGDRALLLDPAAASAASGLPAVEKIDLGSTWTEHTGLPFVYAFWAGIPGRLTAADVSALQAARDSGIERPDEIARGYFTTPEEQALGAAYLRDNIKYSLGADERAALEHFFRYAVEAGAVDQALPLRFF
jgi:chorismate dehydratase